MWQERPQQEKRYMQTEQAKGIIREAVEMRVEMLRYHGVGESTLHPQLLEIMQYGAQYADRIDFSLSTNGSLLRNGLAQGIQERTELELILAVPWVDQRKDFVWQCLSNVVDYLRRKPRHRMLTVQMVTHVLAQEYVPVLWELLALIEDLPWARMYLKAPVTWPGDKPQMGFDVPQEFRNHPKVVADPFRTPRSIGAGCSMPERVLMICADGTPKPCCVSVQTGWGLQRLENGATVGQVWQSGRMQQIRDQWRAKSDEIPCGHCQTRQDCV